MLFLALQRNYGIGRLAFQSEEFPAQKTKQESLTETLQWKGKESLFEELVSKYLLQTSISGIQPKVLVSDNRATFNTPELIIKSGLEQYPGLAVNEYVCMSAAQNCGLSVPDFYLSDDCASPRKDLESFFRILVLSVAVGNGDAHKKNFSLRYDDIQRPETIRLAPVYDIVSTLPYLENDTPALKMNGHKKYFPKENELKRFGKQIGIRQPEKIIHQILDVVSDTRKNQSALLQDYPFIVKAIQKAISRCAG